MCVCYKVNEIAAADKMFEKQGRHQKAMAQMPPNQPERKRNRKRGREQERQTQREASEIARLTINWPK